MEKTGRAFQLFILSFAMAFFLSTVPMSAVAYAKGDPEPVDWKKVRSCHDGLRAKMKNCAKKSKSKCMKKALKSFKTCVKKETKDAKLKKGSSYKKLSKSIQKVVDAVQPLFRKCYDKASAFEKKEIAEAKKKSKDKSDLKKDIKKIQKESEQIRGECFSTAQKMSSKALEAQVGQHFK